MFGAADCVDREQVVSPVFTCRHMYLSVASYSKC